MLGFATDEQRASFTEFVLPQAQSGAASVALDRDGTPWVLTQFAIDRVGTNGHVTAFPMPPNLRGLYGGIALGRDGALWFLGDVANPSSPQGNPWLTRAFRLTTKGKLNVYDIGKIESMEGNQPEDITSGIDGRLWFTISTFAPDFPCLQYGAISTDGARGPVKALCAAKGIAAGPDGNMWVTFGGLDPAAEQGVVRYSAETNTQSYVKLPLTSNPESIATGPDDNLWITLVGFNAIVRLTTTGKKTTYLLPTPDAFKKETYGSQEAKIVSGSNAMWFVEPHANNIARISMSGQITEYAIPTPHSGATGLAISSPCGSYGVHLWFVESARNKLAMMTTQC